MEIERDTTKSPLDTLAWLRSLISAGLMRGRIRVDLQTPYRYDAYLPDCMICATPPRPCFEGVHPKIVAERLRHSTVMITLDTYSHVLNGRRESANRLDSLLGSNSA